MSTLLVGYDLNRPGQDYANLIERIKQIGVWWHHLDSTWLVKTGLTPAQLRDDLKRYVDSGDELLVLDVTGAAWAGTGFDSYDWLHNKL
ncbi:MAG: SinR family protein [Actinomycetota bacterium]